MKLSRPGTLIVADNVVRDGKVIDPKNPDPNIQGVRRFTEHARRRAPPHRHRAADRGQQRLRRLYPRRRAPLKTRRPLRETASLDTFRVRVSAVANPAAAALLR